MNQKALETLEYNTILEILSTFATAEMTKNRILSLHPSDNLLRIQTQLKEVTEACSILKRTSSVPLQNLQGIDLILLKLEKETNLLPEELSAVANLIRNLKRLQKFMQDQTYYAPTISSYVHSISDLHHILEEIDQCIENSRIVDHATPTLDKIRKKMYVVEGRIKAKLENITTSSAYKKYLQDTNISKKNNCYVVSVKAEYKKEIPGRVIERSNTGSTLFVEPDAIMMYQVELAGLQDQEDNEVYQILSSLTRLVFDHLTPLRLNIETLITYDLIFAKAKYSRSIDGIAPNVNYNQHIVIHNGRHPLLPKDCVPLNFNIGNDYRALVITGPNTGGKTVALKTVGLLTLMTQTGLHIPAQKGTEISIYAEVLVDIGDGQSIAQSLSTFSSHIKNIVEILKLASKYTLVILDEVGAGTDPTEGEGLAMAILESLFQKGATIISSSHYPKIKTYAHEKPGFLNGKMTFNVETLKPNYVLQIGEAGESNAFLIALRLGMEVPLIEQAHVWAYGEEKAYDSASLAKSHTHKNQTRVLSTTMQPTSNDQFPTIDSVSSIDVSLSENASVSTSSSFTNSMALAPTKSAIKQPKGVHQLKKSQEKKPDLVTYQIGDKVYIHYLKMSGIIYDLENKRGEYGVQVQGKKMSIHKSRLKLFIEAKDLYPDDYDFDIIFETVENRKKKHILDRKFDPTVTIVHVEGVKEDGR